jgi:hypothetical protein
MPGMTLFLLFDIPGSTAVAKADLDEAALKVMGRHLVPHPSKQVMEVRQLANPDQRILAANDTFDALAEAIRRDQENWWRSSAFSKPGTIPYAEGREEPILITPEEWGEAILCLLQARPAPDKLRLLMPMFFPGDPWHLDRSGEDGWLQ